MLEVIKIRAIWDVSWCFSIFKGFSGRGSGKEPDCNAGDVRDKRRVFDPWIQKIPWRRAWQPTLVFLPGESKGQRSLQSMGAQRVGHDWSDLAHVQQLHYFCVKMSPSHCINISVVSITDFQKIRETQNTGNTQWGQKKKKSKPLSLLHVFYGGNGGGGLHTITNWISNILDNNLFYQCYLIIYIL